MKRTVLDSILVATLAAASPMTHGAEAAPGTTEPAQAERSEAVARLAAEVRTQGWVVFGARSEKGDWDLFLCRPDGSARRNLTQTPGFNEFSPQFSRDGRRLLYRRVPRSEKIDNNHHGTQGELVFANSDGTAPEVFGKLGEYPWASWSPDGKQVACLSIQGIFFVEVATRQTVRTLPRKGFFQQVTWSPDGQWLCGVANSFGASWSIARLAVATGTAEAVNLIDCCTPDWFPDSRRVIFSWRPPGQKANKGYGWTQLWMTDAETKQPQLVYGEEGRHVYGGQVSPDGRYALFTGNMNEDGDPGNAGAPMGLMRLADAPIICGASKELRALHPQTKDGPVLALPAGWEPCWTRSELPVGGAQPAASPADQSSAAPAGPTAGPATAAQDVDKLAGEVRDKGWIAYSARTDQGDWDLFVMRPDGSARRKLTDTRQFSEAGGRFSPDGRRFLYYRLPVSEAVDNNTYGTDELVISEADGTHSTVWGRGFSWASWSTDGTQLACLSPQGIQVVDVQTRQIVRQWPRKGLVQQLVWSPDGKWFAGTANGLGPFWNIGRLAPETGVLEAVSETERYNCTPDWLPDSQRILYSRGIIPPASGRAELWVAGGPEHERRPLYVEEGRHIYGGCASPDSRYLLFTRSEEDLGKVDNSRTTMALIRWQDTPMIGDSSRALRQRLPQAKSGPRLDLGPGWEPHWTYAEVTKPAEGGSH
jgi:Tol biopolymer transport system component